MSPLHRKLLRKTDRPWFGNTKSLRLGGKSPVGLAVAVVIAWSENIRCVAELVNLIGRAEVARDEPLARIGRKTLMSVLPSPSKSATLFLGITGPATGASEMSPSIVERHAAPRFVVRSLPLLDALVVDPDIGRKILSTCRRPKPSLCCPSGPSRSRPCGLRAGACPNFLGRLFGEP